MKNIWLWVLGIGAAGAGILAFQKKQVQSNMSFRIAKVTSNIKKLQIKDILPIVGKGIQFKIDVEITNPTKGHITLNKPFIKLFSNGNIVGQGNAEAKTFEIKKMGDTLIDGIALNITSDQFITLVLSAVPVLKSKKPLQIATEIISNWQKIYSALNLEVEYSTYVEGIFYSAKQKV